MSKKKKRKPFPSYHAPGEKPMTIPKAKPEPEPEAIQKTIEALACEVHGLQLPADQLVFNFGAGNCYNRMFCSKCFIDLLERNNVRQLEIKQFPVDSAVG